MDEDAINLPSKYTVELEGISEKLTCHLIISSPDHVPSHLLPRAKHILQEDTAPSGIQAYSSVARCVAIIDRPISFSTTPLIPGSSVSDAGITENPPQEASIGQGLDTAVLIFPPSSLPAGSATTAVHALITGEGSMSTPSGKCVFDT